MMKISSLLHGSTFYFNSKTLLPTREHWISTFTKILQTVFRRDSLEHFETFPLIFGSPAWKLRRELASTLTSRSVSSIITSVSGNSTRHPNLKEDRKQLPSRPNSLPVNLHAQRRKHCPFRLPESTHIRFVLNHFRSIFQAKQ
jgi:hypothetical protein